MGDMLQMAMVKALSTRVFEYNMTSSDPFKRAAQHPRDLVCRCVCMFSVGSHSLVSLTPLYRSHSLWH
jgi:hypothetical protein